MQLTFRIAMKDMEKVLRTSGTDAFFIRPFFEHNEEVEHYKVVPFPEGTDLNGALSQAARIAQHCGVVKTRRGYGIRISAEHFEDLVRIIYPEDLAGPIGATYEVSGLPLPCG